MFKPSSQRAGNQALQRLLSGHVLQAKLTVNTPGDRYEQEADRVADQVLRMPASDAIDPAQRPPEIQRLCSECEEEVQAKEVPGQVPEVGPGTASQIASLRGGGRPLPADARAFLEPRFGYDFSRVRVHADAGSAHLAQSMQARAFTVGQNVVFGAGEYAPETSEGKRLLAHELTHVVQQGTAPGRPPPVQRQSETGDLVLRLGEDGRVEVLYGTPDLPVTGSLGAGFRCHNGRCDPVGAHDPAGGGRTYTVDEAMELLQGRGGGATIDGCPPGRISPVGCCPPGQVWIRDEFRCGVPPPIVMCPPERQNPTDLAECCPPGTTFRIGDGCVTPAPPPETPSVPERTSPSFRFSDLRQYVIDRFAFDDATVPASASTTLDWIATQVFIRDVPALIVEGHTDSTGDEAYNEDLSLRRARAVKAALEARGVSAGRITVEASGEQSLEVAPEQSAADRARNRRVVVYWIQSVDRSLHLIPPLRLRSGLIP